MNSHKQRLKFLLQSYEAVINGNYGVRHIGLNIFLICLQQKDPIYRYPIYAQVAVYIQMSSGFDPFLALLFEHLFAGLEQSGDPIIALHLQGVVGSGDLCMAVAGFRGKIDEDWGGISLF